MTHLSDNFQKIDLPIWMTIFIQVCEMQDDTTLFDENLTLLDTIFEN